MATGRDLVHYLYTGRPREGSDPVGMLEVAEQYDLPELMVWAEEALAASLSDTNYCQLMQLAELYSIQSLKAAVIRYIASHAGRLIH